MTLFPRSLLTLPLYFFLSPRYLESLVLSPFLFFSLFFPEDNAAKGRKIFSSRGFTQPASLRKVD